MTVAAASRSNPLLLIAIAIVLGLIAYAILTMPDQRSGMEKVGDAIHDLPQGVDKAGRQLENRTPGQKLGDAVKDTGDDIKRNTQ